ncbi:hypothetical protein [Neorhizobium galegae]|uniref:Possible BirS-like protein incolved in biotin regulatory network n=1 Tax=Neorhizobium galegae bv. officinalis TaxID=323656 RepID=A0A0T7GA81_NEOGA|nr:hypothetical protein [Neorhizobium galegae]CDZ44223.1 Possible BirS-like protein incolved in biotin regulatory network [Neorhizobium galegae bv. officinalis]
MSGLETAIRNALDRSNRADREIRARIYQSARQALDAGLRKQGVTDRLIIMQQHELLERKIHEIEMAEVERLVEPAPGPAVELEPELPYAAEPMAVESPVMPTSPRPEAPQRPAAPSPVAPSIDTVSGEVRAPSAAATISSGDLGGVSPARGERVEAEQFQPESPAKAAKPGKPNRNARPSSDSGLDVPPERAAKPRKRRGFLSHLLTWVITLGVVGGACWWFYQSGLVQSIVEEAMKSADRSVAGQAAGGPVAFDPRRGFSDEWVEIFVPAKAAEMKAGGQAKVEAVAASEGQAVRIASATSGDGGDVSVEVPPEVLREMAGKSSTVALTLQSGQDSSVQLSVRCDFGSLGNCSRHRFTATQEKLEALFRVTFERSLAPNRPGRLIFNSGIDGADRAVLLYSVRILPGQ